MALRLTKGSFRGSDTFLLALTQSGVPYGGFGVEVPVEIVSTLKRLDSSKPTYLVTSEYNADTAEHPSFEDCDYLGKIPMEFLKPILLGLIDRIKSGASEVYRTGS